MTQIGAYQIERELGRGGFGVVYIGVDTRLGRRAAIKQLLPELSGHRDIVERFFNEAKAAASINHPGIVEIYDVGWHTDGSAYFAMKLLDGESLGRRLRARGPLAVGLACTIARQVASALVAAHGAGIVHRDLKPDNIILVRDDEIAIGERAIVLDFGIAKLGGGPGTSQTRTGVMMGTPNYMSPEQCKGAGEVDHRTDVYALGCILFELLTGRVPFVGEGPGEVMGMHQFVEPPPLRSLRPDAPDTLEALIAQLLAKKLDQRMQQMAAVHAALQPFAGGMSREHPIAFGPTMPVSPVAPVDANAQTALSEPDVMRAPRVDAVSAAARAANQPPMTADPYIDPISRAAREANRPPASERNMPPPAKTTLSSASAEVAAAPPRKSRGLALVFGGIGIACVGIAVAVIAGSGGSSNGSGVASGSAASASSASGSSAVATNVPPDATTAVDTGDLAAKCQQLEDQMKWSELASCATELTATNPTRGGHYATIAKAESEAKVAFEDMQTAIRANDLPAAKAALRKIPLGSIYQEQAQRRYDDIVAAAGSAAGGAATTVKDALTGRAQIGIRAECQRIQAEKRWMALVECANRLTAAGDPQGKQLLDLATKETKAEARRRARNNITQAELDAGIAKVQPAVIECFKRNGGTGTAKVQLVIETTGAVSKAMVSGAFGGTPTGTCIEAAVRGATFPPFSGNSQTWSKDIVHEDVQAPAQQDPKARAKQLFADGTAAYNLAQFEKAIDKFKAAYELVPEPVFLFNIAQGYRKLDDKRNAIFFYQRYLSANPSATNAAQVRQFITDLGGQPP